MQRGKHNYVPSLLDGIVVMPPQLRRFWATSGSATFMEAGSWSTKVEPPPQEICLSLSTSQQG